VARLRRYLAGAWAETLSFGDLEFAGKREAIVGLYSVRHTWVRRTLAVDLEDVRRFLADVFVEQEVNGLPLLELQVRVQHRTGQLGAGQRPARGQDVAPGLPEVTAFRHR
jgi:hypothetical protein